jgi:methyl-accepting chemotaxis protein
VTAALEKFDEQTTAILSAASSAVQSSREVLAHSTRVEQENVALVSRIEESAERVRNLESRMRALVEKIKRVDVVVDEIDSIAFQTNILSLNAAVESAHAGKAGASFGIVADAVRNLAGRTKTATDEISKATSGIQSEVALVSKASQEIAATIHQLSLDAQSSNQGIRGNVNKANQTLGEMETMKHACAIQKNINSEMKSHIQQVLEGSKRNVSFAETLQQSCEDLRLIQGDLEESVSRYRVE